MLRENTEIQKVNRKNKPGKKSISIIQHIYSLMTPGEWGAKIVARVKTTPPKRPRKKEKKWKRKGGDMYDKVWDRKDSLRHRPIIKQIASHATVYQS